MKKIAISLFTLSTLILFMFLNTSLVNAQVGQLWETIVGNPADKTGPVYDGEGNEQVGTGSDDLGPGEFLIPFKCSLGYYSLTYPLHSAYSIDLNRGIRGEDQGDPVYASADGAVIDIMDGSGQVIIRHEGGYWTLYGHMWPYFVKVGQRVKAGQEIGKVNDRGAARGAHHIHYNQCLNCSSIGQCRELPTSTYKGCRIKIKFKGYEADQNSQFPYTGNKDFYYKKCY